jgi:hypothetical protein
MGFYPAGNDIHTFGFLLMCGIKHGAGFANARD